MTQRISAAELKVIQAAPKSKYGNQKVTVLGEEFDSKREADRWLLLRDRQRAGEISDLRRQVKIPLDGRDGPLRTSTGRVMCYIADFAYLNLDNGLMVYEDAKGFATPEYKVKAAVVRAMGLDLEEV